MGLLRLRLRSRKLRRCGHGPQSGVHIPPPPPRLLCDLRKVTQPLWAAAPLLCSGVLTLLISSLIVRLGTAPRGVHLGQAELSV